MKTALHCLIFSGRQVPNMAPVIGELAFFLGIVQPMSVRTRQDGDVQLLVLSKEDSYPLFDSYPEQVPHYLHILLTYYFRKMRVGYV
jgi:hypothetical protein